MFKLIEFWSESKIDPGTLSKVSHELLVFSLGGTHLLTKFNENARNRNRNNVGKMTKSNKLNSIY